MLRGVVLYAKNLEALTAFYTVIGGKILDQNEGEFVIVGDDEAELTIVQAPESIASQIVIENPPVPRSSTPLKPVFRVPSLDLALEAISENGGTSLAGARPWTYRNALIQDVVDPEGNIVQLWEPV